MHGTSPGGSLGTLMLKAAMKDGRGGEREACRRKRGIAGSQTMLSWDCSSISSPVSQCLRSVISDLLVWIISVLEATSLFSSVYRSHTREVSPWASQGLRKLEERPTSQTHLAKEPGPRHPGGLPPWPRTTPLISDSTRVRSTPGAASISTLTWPASWLLNSFISFRGREGRHSETEGGSQS